MKRNLVFLCFFLLLSINLVAAEKAYKLKDAIALTIKGLSEKLDKGTKVAIIDIQGPTQDAVGYVVDQLTYELVNSGSFIVVDRASIESIRKELQFQMSGEVSDESAQSIGQMLGAESIITGSLSQRGDEYRLNIKGVRVQTSEIRYLQNLKVATDATLLSLVGKQTGTEKAVTAVGSAAKTVAFGVADITGRIFCSAINPFFGIGSAIQKDSKGVKIVVIGELLSLGLLGYGSVKMNEEAEQGIYDGDGPILVGVGGLLGLFTVCYAVVKPLIYQKPSLANVFDHIDVSSTSMQTVSLSYKVPY